MPPAETAAVAKDGPPTAPGEDGCPVCLEPLGDESDCPTCRWPLRSGWLLGTVTAEQRRAFDERLLDAQRRFDLGAAARAGGDADLLARMEALVRGGPPRPGDREEVAGAVADQPVDEGPGTVRAIAQAAAEGGAAGIVVAELDVDGLAVSRFAAGAGPGLRETAGTEVRPWTSLLPMLPADPDERRFQLAGGIGTRPIAPAAVRARLAEGLPGALAPGGERLVLLSRLPGWRIPEQALDLLRERHPAGQVLRRAAPPSGARDVSLHGPERVTAFAAAETGAGGLWVVAGGSDGAATGWTLPAVEPVVQRPLHDGRVTAIDVAADGTAVTGGRDGVVRLWSLRSPDPARPVAWHNGWVNAVRLRAGVVFSLGDDELLRRSALGDPSGAGGSAYPVEVGWSAATALAVDADARTVAVGGRDGVVSLWDGTSGRSLGTVPTGAGIEALALDPGGAVLAVGGADGTVRVYGLPARTLLASLPGHTGAVLSVVVEAGRWVATGDEQHVVRLWSPDGTGEVIGTHQDEIRGLYLTGDGRLLSAGADGLIRAWGVTAG
jgi:WD domain, G-beta repeat